MNTKDNNQSLLDICENYLSSIKSLVSKKAPGELRIQLDQKLFLLDASLYELRKNFSQAAEANTASAASISAAHSNDLAGSAGLKGAASAMTYMAGTAGTQAGAAAGNYTASQAEGLPESLKKAVEDYEKSIILKAIDMKGSKRKAATALGMEHSTLIKKCQRYGI